MTSTKGAVALWHCCACGREWRAENPSDDTECCPFAPKMLAFGTKTAWGQRSMDDPSEDEYDLNVEQLAKASSSALDKVSKLSTAPGSRSSGPGSEQASSPGCECRAAELEEHLPQAAARRLLSSREVGLATGRSPL
mmetsp:Transcript_126618/g.300814  ORF Transcript_126618/g.300814 Transcript_126618/m.300814 type:complete len:137 (-) Transcript_126618:118-528(-)